MNIKHFSCAAALAVGLLAGPAAAFDHSVFDGILRTHVNDEGYVDYDGVRKNAAALKVYLESLAQADLAGQPYEERAAFWINAYNACVIKSIVDNPQLKKVSDNFGLFDKPFNLAGGHYTLNEIENRIIRGKTDKNKKGPIPGVTLQKFDRRIHFALVCAARDCPRLLNKAYTAQNLEETLQSAAVRFANYPKHVMISDGRLRLSSLLKWYAADFDAVGGVADFIAGLTDVSLRPDAARVDELLKTQLDKAAYVYDWTVNDVKNQPK